MLRATCVEWHIENSKNDKKSDIAQHHIDANITFFIIFAVFDVSFYTCCR